MSPTAPIDGERHYYRPELDWLRFMAFLMVFLMHACPVEPEKYATLGIPHSVAQFVISPIIQAGGYGVDLFFALSAFLITELLLKEKESTGKVHVRAFYLRRILRIWPLYITFILVAMPYEVLSKGIPIRYYVFMLTFIGNWHAVLFGNLPTLCGNLWSICLEEQFYIVWPNLLGRVQTKRFASILIAMFLFSCLYRILYVYTSPPYPYAVWYNSFTRLDSFALGGLLACALHGRQTVWPRPARVLTFFAAVTIFWGLGNLPIGGYFGEYPADHPLAALGVLLIVAFVTSPTRSSMSLPLRVLSYRKDFVWGAYFTGPYFGFGNTRLEWPTREWAWCFGYRFLRNRANDVHDPYSVIENHFCTEATVHFRSLTSRIGWHRCT